MVFFFDDLCSNNYHSFLMRTIRIIINCHNMIRNWIFISLFLFLVNNNSKILIAQIPPDETSASISEVSMGGITDSSTIISWIINKDSSKLVAYDLNIGYGNEGTVDTILVLNSNMEFTTLGGNSTYHYWMKSTDVESNITLKTKQSLERKAAAELTFTDITISAGTGGPTEPSQTGGHGVFFADVDDDSLPDLYITMRYDNPMADLFYRNTGGNIFADEGVLRGIADFDGGSHGACFADLDNDGDYDLINGTTDATPGFPAINNIFRNDGNGFFTDVTSLSGIPIREWPTRGVLAFDMDSDGDLDLFCVTNWLGTDDPPEECNEVYRNDGNMQFTPINQGVLYTCPAGQGAIDTDYDNDGDIDIIAANNTGPINILRNDENSSFTLVSPVSIGIIHQGDIDGVSMADIDNDSDLDMLLTGDPYGYLYMNSGEGTFTFNRSFSNIEGYMGGFADLDNDSDLDLVFAGDDICYLNDGFGNFTVGPSIPISGIADPRAIGFADIDNDGDLDFAVGCKDSRNWLIRNNFDSGNWLKLRLISPKGQAGAFGAKTRIYPAGQAGRTLLGMRESRSNNGYLGQDDPVLHFGLGAHTSVDVEVTFFDRSPAIQRNVAANQTITIEIEHYVYVSGTVRYFGTDSPIENVALTASGEESQIELTDSNGHYEFSKLVASENYNVKPSKPEDTDIGSFTITTYDAALTAQSAIGIRNLTDFETIAADVDRDHQIYAYDAALIAQYAVGLPKNPVSHVGDWKFVPDSICYQTLDSNKTNQSYSGIILGNVHGGWSQSGGLVKENVVFKKYTYLTDLTANSGEEIVIPFVIEGGLEVISIDIDFFYDFQVLKLIEISKPELPQNYELVFNDEQGRLRIGLYSIEPKNSEGVLLNIIFKVIGDAGKTSYLSLRKYQINCNVIMNAEAQLTIGKKNEIPASFLLEQNYPNPFNSETIISYQIPWSGWISLKIFDQLGREVRTLIDEHQKAGIHKVKWDGTNQKDHKVTNGIYIYQLEANDYIEAKKLLLLK